MADQKMRHSGYTNLTSGQAATFFMRHRTIFCQTMSVGRADLLKPVSDTRTRASQTLYPRLFQTLHRRLLGPDRWLSVALSESSQTLDEAS